MRCTIRVLAAALVVAALLAGGCGTESAAPGDEAPSSREEPRNQAAAGPGAGLQQVSYWAYQIQDQEAPGNLRRLADSRYELLVIDQTRSLKGEEDYDSLGVVERLKASSPTPEHERLVVCYIDVGEAESYRWYWRNGWRVGDPEWIAAPDPDGWDENYPVKFWRAEWKGIILEYLDRIIADGYDGAYLDWLEIYSFEPVAEAAAAEGLDAREELVKLVREIAGYARSRAPGFILIAQNAAELVEAPGYAVTFDAVAQEAVWFDGGGDPDTGERVGDVPTPADLTEEYLSYLAQWQRAGRPVFDVEYAVEPDNAERAYRYGAEHGFRTYVTTRPLDALSATPPPGY